MDEKMRNLAMSITSLSCELYLTKSIFSKEIKKWRTEKRISQKELAKQIGISSQYLCDIENGRRDITKDITQKIFHSLSEIF